METVIERHTQDGPVILGDAPKRLGVVKLGLIVGAFLGAFHACWSLIVASGYAQVLLDWVFWLHMLNNPLKVDAFSAPRALVLVALTTAIGYLYGAVFALIWNAFQKA